MEIAPGIGTIKKFVLSLHCDEEKRNISKSKKVLQKSAKNFSKRNIFCIFAKRKENNKILEPPGVQVNREKENGLR